MHFFKFDILKSITAWSFKLSQLIEDDEKVDYLVT